MNSKIIVIPPGPKSKELAMLRDKYVPKAVYNITPIFVAESEGAIIRDVDGNEYIDFATGISCLNIGQEPRSYKSYKGTVG
jgi:4-aminobutyrate aminotransferase-like enzyme